MIRVRYQRIILLLLMWVFGVQGLASANSSCDHEPSSSKAAEHAMSFQMVEHSQHLELASSSDVVATPDCCPDCDCSLGGCSNLAILSGSHTVTSFEIVLPSSQYSERFEDSLALSLFRPPVSC